MSDALIKSARLDAARDIAVGLIEAINDALAKHGPDPESEVLVIAGLTLAIRRIAAKRPTIAEATRILLNDRAPSGGPA